MGRNSAYAAASRATARASASRAAHAERELWRKIAQGSARVIYGKDPAGSPFATLQAAYALDDEALLAAINSHPLYAGWPEYDNKPDAAPPAAGLPTPT
jgi:hypothetical protein